MIRRPPRSTLFPSTTLVRSAVTRELAAMPPEGAVERLERDFGLDELAARNLAQFLSDQKEQGGAVPDDRTIVVERFRDEIGDYRVCVLSPFGAKVHAPWSMAIRSRLDERYGLDVQVLWSDEIGRASCRERV